MPQNVLVLGASSKIAQAVAQRFAARGDKFVLAGRKPDRLQAVANDLRARGSGQVETIETELADTSKHAGIIDKTIALIGKPDVVLLAYGSLSDQAKAEESPGYFEQEVKVNFVSAASFLLRAVKSLAGGGSQRSIIVIGSVAGDRGRKSNFVYGCAKAGLEAFVSGLRGRYAAEGVHVMLVKPGFVDTPMTAHFKKNALFADADAVGEGIFRACLRKRDVLYIPWFWRYIMLIINIIPEWIFKRLSL